MEIFGYDERDRMTRRSLGTATTGGTDLEEFLYELDNAGNITKTTELDGTVWDYAYDDRYRLTTAEANGRTTTAESIRAHIGKLSAVARPPTGTTC